MPPHLPESAAAENSGRWRLGAAMLIFASAGLHLGYLAWNCPLDLAPDEAHYWDWSRHLDWSYYSKGPLVAYLIHLGTTLASAWSQQAIGSEMLAVRLPAVICGALMLLSLYILTSQVYRSERLGFFVVALALTLPPVAAGASLMTIDAPYTCCWGWALVLGYQATVRGSRWAWPAAGIVLGTGMLAKYTMVLWLPSLALFLLTQPELRRSLFQRGFWILTSIAFACCLPILIWNAQHDWVTFRHVSGQAGLSQDENRVHWLGPLNFVGVQFLLLLGFWFAVWIAAMIAHRPTKETDLGLRYLWWMSAPMFVVFLLFGFKTGGGEPNWPITAYLSGLVLAAGYLDRQLRSPTVWHRRLATSGLIGSCALGLLLIALVHYSNQAHAALSWLSGPPTPAQPMPLRRFDPTCRLRGWHFLASEVDRQREQLRRDGIDPILAASGWSLPGELGFYCAGHPPVYSLGLALGDRWSQYDFWRPNPMSDADEFRGRDFIFVGIFSPVLADAFEKVEPPQIITYRENGHAIAAWGITICRGFRGFPKSAILQVGRPRY